MATAVEETNVPVKTYLAIRLLWSVSDERYSSIASAPHSTFAGHHSMVLTLSFILFGSPNHIWSENCTLA
ncbi:hypothetical protein EB796_003355 [Bugula neritina]|uniref:Uncharacterized protein n=1 Tax=Bugula neritina TaxID=10212 RepID=A0A7J7KJD0_BUGNE|nr:hypothetical protein EB796_003355 [Bugula neritina]